VWNVERAVPVVWTLKDRKGIAGTPRDVARKIVRAPYDAFRLEVSRSYRELFARDLKNVLERKTADSPAEAPHPKVPAERRST
jgi:hypothetical protein